MPNCSVVSNFASILGLTVQEGCSWNYNNVKLAVTLRRRDFAGKQYTKASIRKRCDFIFIHRRRDSSEF